MTSLLKLLIVRNNWKMSILSFAQWNKKILGKTQDFFCLKEDRKTLNHLETNTLETRSIGDAKHRVCTLIGGDFKFGTSVLLASRIGFICCNWFFRSVSFSR